MTTSMSRFVATSIIVGCLYLCSAQNLITFVSIQDDDFSSENLQNGLDCNRFGSYNITINVATRTVQYYSGTFDLFREIRNALYDEHQLALLELGVVKQYMSTLETSPCHDIYVIEESVNEPSTWCTLVGRLIQGSLPPPDTMLQSPKNNVLDITEPESKSPVCSSGSTKTVTPVVGSESDVYPDGVTPLEQWWNLDRKKAKVILDVARREGWDQFLVLYEKRFEQQVRALLDIASSSYMKAQVVRIADNKELIDTLFHYLETSPDFNAVLITSVEEAQNVLKLAQSLQFEMGKSISVTGLTKWLLFCQEGVVSKDSWLFSSMFDNIAVLCKPETAADAENTRSNCDDELHLSTLLYKEKHRELTLVGAVLRDWTLIIQYDVFPNTKFGFNGRELVVSTNAWPPYVYSREVNGTKEYYGFCMDLAQELSRSMNFTIRWVEPPDGNWGAVDSNGSWNGLVGQMQREEIDMILAPIGVTGAREAVLDFSSAFFYDDTAVILKMPDPNESKWRTYIDIFRQEVLMCIAVALLVGSLILYLLTKVERIMYGRQHKVFASSWTGCILYLYGAMLAQGGRNLPASGAGRAFLSGWWLFCIVVAGTFSGNLIAVLTVSKDKAPFETLKDMAAQSEYRFGTLGNSMWTELFRTLAAFLFDQTSPRPEFQALHHMMQDFAEADPDIIHNDADVHLQKVKDGGYAYIADKGLFSFWLATNCDLILLKEKFFPSKYAIGLPNNSVYTKFFSDQVGKIYESGLLQVWVKKWWPKQTFCSGSLVTEARTLTLMDVQSSFYVLAIGVGVAGVVLSLETGYSILRQGLRSSAWVQGKLRNVKGRVGKLLSWGLWVERDTDSNNSNNNNNNPSTIANRGLCDNNGHVNEEIGYGRCEGRGDGGSQQYKRKLRLLKKNNVDLQGRNPKQRSKVSKKYEVNFNDANQYRDIYYCNRGYSNGETGIQNETDRVFISSETDFHIADLTKLSRKQSIPQVSANT